LRDYCTTETTIDPAAANALADKLMDVLVGEGPVLGANALAYALGNVIYQVASDEAHAAEITASLGEFVCDLLDDIYAGEVPMVSDHGNDSDQILTQGLPRPRVMAAAGQAARTAAAGAAC
jgi:hypothetical protein